jgi:UPF0755 protein
MSKNYKIISIILGGIILTLVIIVSGIYYSFFSSPQSQGTEEVLVVDKTQTKLEIVDEIVSRGFVRSERVFKWILFNEDNKSKDILPGGYYLSKNMNVWETVQEITSPPDMKWVTIPPGYRKEQIGEVMAETFSWSEEELQKWNTVHTTTDDDYIEGTYFPDTYLIPIDEGPSGVAKRMRRNFEKKFAPYMEEFAKENIKWTTGLTLASIIQREGAGKEDMAIISSVLWKRLEVGMKLEMDATVQYARGKVERGWWAPPTGDDIRSIDSPFNTYKYSGLPPHPIANPGTIAIEAALNPVATDCIFYLHDRNQQIHCSETYAGHLDNIEKYLNN